MRIRIRVVHIVYGMVPLAVILAGVAKVQEASILAKQAQCAGHLAHIGVELANYRDRHGHLPPTYTVDANGRALHSWRVLLYAEIEPNFAKSYDFLEPWDGPNNIRLANQIPDMFSCKNSRHNHAACASYFALTSDDSGGPEYLNPTRQTLDKAGGLIIVEYPNADILWTDPRDIGIDDVRSISPGFDPDGIGVVRADMRAHRLPMQALLREIASGPGKDTMQPRKFQW
jgi:hypothetical protein